MTLAAAVLLLVTLQRLVELVIAHRNTRALLARGAHEASPEHYPFIVAVHVAWLASLWWLGSSRDVDLVWLGVLGLLQIGRIWVLATLGERWTTRIIVLPGAPLVRSGPYRLVSHPNYLIVVGEIAVLPLALGLPVLALVFSVLNGLVLWVRIRAETAALAATQTGASGPGTRSGG